MTATSRDAAGTMYTLVAPLCHSTGKAGLTRTTCTGAVAALFVLLTLKILRVLESLCSTAQAGSAWAKLRLVARKCMHIYGGTQVPTGTGRALSKLARVAPLQDGDFQDAPGTQVPTGTGRAASKLARAAPSQDGALLRHGLGCAKASRISGRARAAGRDM